MKLCGPVNAALIAALCLSGCGSAGGGGKSTAGQPSLAAASIAVCSGTRPWRTGPFLVTFFGDGTAQIADDPNAGSAARELDSGVRAAIGEVGIARWAITTDPDGNLRLTLTDSTGTERSSKLTLNTSSPHLEFLGLDGKAGRFCMSRPKS